MGMQTYWRHSRICAPTSLSRAQDTHVLQGCYTWQLLAQWRPRRQRQRLTIRVTHAPPCRRYKLLRKPWFTPPDPVFGIAWTLLYILMGLAAYRVYYKVGWPSWALQVYLGQLALNLLWYVLFFDAKQPRAAQLGNVAFVILACYTTYLFFEVDSTAGCLMLPYVAWAAFANLLNLSIVKKN